VRTLLQLFFVALAALVLAGCAGTAPIDGDGTAATVDGVSISRAQLEAGVRDFLGPLEALPPEERAAQVGALQRQILGFQIQGAVFERLAADEGIEVDDADLELARQRLLEATGGQEQLDQLLAREGLTPALLEELILPQEVRLAELSEVLGGPEQLNPILVEAIRDADIEVAPGLGDWSEEELRVLPAGRVGAQEPAVPLPG
jgi:outer membrane murein-binding lipoprotein Lpp